MMKEYILDRFNEAERLRKEIMKDDSLLNCIADATTLLAQKIKEDKSIYFCGNGGSAADAQHLATELSGRFLHDRRAIKAEALGTNMAFITAIANDYSYDKVFARSLEALGRKGDALVLISTSGNSRNIIEAAKQAKLMSIDTIGITGALGNKLGDLCDFHIKVPSKAVPRIQEAYMLVGHIMCEHLEKTLITLENIEGNEAS